MQRSCGDAVIFVIMKARAAAAAVAACCSSVTDASIVWHQGRIIDDCQLWLVAAVCLCMRVVTCAL